MGAGSLPVYSRSWRGCLIGYRTNDHYGKLSHCQTGNGPSHLWYGSYCRPHIGFAIGGLFSGSFLLALYFLHQQPPGNHRQPFDSKLCQKPEIWRKTEGKSSRLDRNLPFGSLYRFFTVCTGTWATRRLVQQQIDCAIERRFIIWSDIIYLEGVNLQISDRKFECVERR